MMIQMCLNFDLDPGFMEMRHTWGHRLAISEWSCSVTIQIMDISNILESERKHLVLRGGGELDRY